MAVLLAIQAIANLFAQAGLSAAIIQRTDVSRRALDSLYWLNVVLGAVVSVIVAALAPLVGNWFNMPQLAHTMPIFAVTIFFAAAGAQYLALAQKSLEFRSIAMIELSAAALSATVSVGLAVAGAGLWALVAGVMSGSFLSMLAWVIRGTRRNGRPRLVFDTNEVAGLISFGLLRFGAMLANTIVSRADQLIVGAVLGAQSLGIYSVAIRLVMQPVERINPIVSRVMFPIFSRFQTDRNLVRRGYLSVIRLLSAVNAPVLIGVAATAQWLVPTVLGDQWLGAVPVVRILAVYAFFRVVINGGGSLILGLGKAGWSFVWNAALLLVLPPVIFVAASRAGLVGLCLVLVIVQILLTLLYHRVFIVRLIAVPLATFVVALGRPIVTAGITVAFVVVVIRSIPSMDEVYRLLCAIVAASALYMLALRLLWIEDWRLLVELFRVRPARVEQG
jgi:O-antigen/teichoic acid export membrane protein